MPNITALQEKIRIFSLGGLDEDGKNMYCVEIGQQIYIIEAGIKFPDEKESLGIEYIVPDFSYLIENKNRIAGIIITHAHDDVMGALPYLVKQIKTTIYCTAVTAKHIRRLFAKENIKDYQIHEVKRHDQKRIGKHKVIFFPITHSVPEAFGVAISTSQGFIVYSGEFIEDYSALDDAYRGDFTTPAQFRNEGVLVLMQDSKGADCSGHTAPNHRIAPHFAKVLEKYENKRIFVSVYTQSVFRIQELIDTCISFNRKILLYTEELRQLIDDLKDIGYEIPANILIDHTKIREEDLSNAVILIGGTGKSLMSLLSNICNNEVSDIDFTSNDVIVLATPVLPGVEREFKQMENDIYKEGGEVIMLDSRTRSVHPSQEDLKMMIFATRPKYYIPVKGEYRKLIMNANVALEMEMSPSQIIILDNGQVATFENKKLKSCALELELHDNLIDGKEGWDMAGVVLKDREILSTDGVMILAIGIDSKTKKIINGPDVQTRGLVYLKDAEYLNSDVSKIMEQTIQDAVKNHTYNNLDTRNEIRDKVARYLSNKIGKKPMILSVILEINTQQ
ncbi:MAG: ribonuclease J [Erysipelotrichaceae bacterium]|uniref:ribonuclease J n=1 Tax=Floccifex sp. TaxID=2815810 RepID=UPI002A759A37|nr:ribonuclease J [Floccifex sp.]MDD7280529.1 ribonuclease J [Erysipelotrichaceae bacterium]MDY2957924.1 ribonuclease J [Floccifex sp.]